MTAEDLEAQEGTKEVWYRVADVDALQEGEVRAVQAGTQSIALTCHRGESGALDNACPHQGDLWGKAASRATAMPTIAGSVAPGMAGTFTP
jgi:pyruvate oxidase